ncbi:MAG: thrombospondin type 3 repeat-containing protein [Candidatus Thermoplasmatota archaeon]|nr:thrombospondin type 3 repeat-containing protein [Candidatus Thermoplasmatota archaeon]
MKSAKDVARLDVASQIPEKAIAVNNPLYLPQYPGMRMAGAASSYESFIRNLANNARDNGQFFLDQRVSQDVSKETLEQIAEYTAMEKWREQFKEKRYEGPSVLSNIIPAQMMGLPGEQDELEDYFEKLEATDPERFKQVYSDYNELHALTEGGIERYRMLGSPAAQIGESETDARYEEGLKPQGLVDRFINSVSEHPVIVGGLILTTVGTAMVINYGWPAISNWLSQKPNEPNNPDSVIIPTTDSDGDGLTDYDEINVYHTDPHNIDTDGDYIRDDLEVKVYHSDPLKIDSDGGGMDDFNETFTYPHYGMDPNNPEDDAEFIKKLPNVIARRWEDSDGGVGIFTTKKYIDISTRDPLINYLAKTAEIRWEGDKGTLFVNGEKIHGGGNVSEHLPKQPSYFFTHERRGICGDVNRAARSILESMGYDSISVVVKIDHGNGQEVGHIVPETVINGKPYLVNYNNIIPRGNFYEENGWRIISPDYDPNWFEKN